MSRTRPRPLVEIAYAEAAQEYLRSLPPEHFMEATAQATQRKITLESLDLVHAHRSDIQLFNELLVQYPLRGQRRPGQVVPDNMVVLSKETIQASGSYDLPLQPVGPFWMLEYVSKHNRRKDYEDNFDKYEKELKVPYFLLFYPDTQDLTLYHPNGKKYIAVRRDEEGRYPIPELELEVALLDGWVRFWFRGELLPLPADLQRQFQETQQQLAQERQRTEELRTLVDQERQARLTTERELERLRAQLSQTQGRSPDTR